MLRRDWKVRVVLNSIFYIRNGGHITPPLYHDYIALKAKHGVDVARSLIQFRLAHLSAILTAASEEVLLEGTGCRKVETLDVYFDSTQWQEAKDKVRVYKKDMPEEAMPIQVWESVEAAKVGWSEWLTNE